MINWLALSNPMEVVPVGDSIEHHRNRRGYMLDSICHCHPQEINGVVVHNPFDARAPFYERGERKPS